MSNIQRSGSVVFTDRTGGKRTVSVGDKVFLSPLLSEEKREWMKEFLHGPEPYTVSGFLKWPCGGINFYFEVPRPHGEPGAKAYDFVPR